MAAYDNAALSTPSEDPPQLVGESDKRRSVSEGFIGLSPVVAASGATSAPLTDTTSKNLVDSELGANSKPKSLKLAGNPKKLKPGEPKLRANAAGNNNPVTIKCPHTGKDQQLTYVDYNFQSVKKGVSSALLDVSLLLANASQLKAVIFDGADKPLYAVVMTLLITSLVLQIVVGGMLVFVGRININDADDKEMRRGDLLNNAVVIGVFLLTVINVFIAAFCVSTPSPAVTVNVPANNVTN